MTTFSSSVKLIICALACTYMLSAPAHAVDGIAVTNFYTCGDGGGWAVTSGGPLYKFEIKNCSVVSNTKLYDGVAWSAVINQEGDSVAFLRGDNMICVMSLEGGAAAEVVPQGGTGKININWPKGRWIWFMEKGDKDLMYKVNIDTKEKVLVFRAPNNNTSFWISADAKRGCSRSRQIIWRHDFETDIVDSMLQYTKCAANKCSGITQCGNGISPTGTYIMSGLFGDVGMDIKRFSNNELIIRYYYGDTKSWPGWPETHTYSGNHCVIEKYSANSDD